VTCFSLQCLLFFSTHPPALCWTNFRIFPTFPHSTPLSPWSVQFELFFLPFLRELLSSRLEYPPLVALFSTPLFIAYNFSPRFHCASQFKPRFHSPSLSGPRSNFLLFFLRKFEIFHVPLCRRRFGARPHIILFLFPPFHLSFDLFGPKVQSRFPLGRLIPPFFPPIFFFSSNRFWGRTRAFHDGRIFVPRIFFILRSPCSILL